MRNLVSLRQNGSTGLLQNLRARHVGNFGRVVGIFDTATGRRQVIYGIAQVGDSGVETVLYRTQVRTKCINLCQGSINFLQWVFSLICINLFKLTACSEVMFVKVAC